MAAVLRKFLPIAPSPSRKDYDEDDDNSAKNGYNIEFSIALKYDGPAVNIDAIPRAIPVDFDHITTALTVSSSSVLNDISVPVVQPVVTTKVAKTQKLPKGSEFGSKHVVYAGSPVGSGVLYSGHEVVGNSSLSSSSSSSRRKHNSGASSASNGWESDAGEVENSENIRAEDHVHMRELPGSSRTLQLPKESDEVGYFEEGRNSGDIKSIESGSRSQVLSTEDLSSRDGDNDNETPLHERRPSITFVDPSTADEDSDCSDCASDPVIQRAERKGKKGSCYRCLMGSRFTEKEVCIVCDAKYCFNCVVRAMGSMPEGRKCVTCIGKRINESRRASLGKSSRLLRRLLTDLEVKQIMSTEISCKTNQLPSQLIYVNGDPLSEEGLYVLQSCQYPPKRLKPGCYWYDKVAGYWGKEGQKPSQIISPQLSVGGNIKQEASNGDTTILINNREITKVELLMLQMAGVQYELRTHFWVSVDGSYQEEGQNHVKGRIWDRKRARLACAILSLPIPPESMKLQANEPTMPYLAQKALHKLLLVGPERSGTSTIYKQARLLYNVPFSGEERESIKVMIQTNLYRYLGMLLEGRERFEDESLSEMMNTESSDQSDHAENTDVRTIYSISPRLKDFSDWILKVMASGNLDIIFPAATREYAQAVADLWNNPAIQATYDRRSEIEMLPGAASYFLEGAIEISKPDYEPSDSDILHAEGITSSVGLSCFDYLFPNSPHDSTIDAYYQHESSLRYQLIRLHPQNLGDNCRWLEMFDDIDTVIFCVSLTSYDEYVEEGSGVLVNKMMLSKQLFETIVTHRALHEKKFLLILSKFDLFVKKIVEVPLTTCEWFCDFNPVVSHNQNSGCSRHGLPMAQRAFHYIAVKFKNLFDSLTDPQVDQRRCYRHKLFVSQVNCLDADTVDMSLRYARDILKWHVEEASLVQEISTMSIEASSSS